MQYIIKNIPNALTTLRILLIPVLVCAFYLDNKTSHYVSASIFIFASITDYIDGLLARRLGVQSSFGRMLDPIADKMLVASTLLMLVESKIAPAVPIVIILCREIFVSGMREYLGTMRKVINVSFMGKLKTTAQMTAIIALLLGEDVLGKIGEPLGITALWTAAFLTLLSGFLYLKEGMKYISLDEL